MVTKICYGPLHSNGKELPINNFRIQKVTTKRPNKTYIYHIPTNICKECAREENKIWRNNNKKHIREKNKKYSKTKKGKDIIRRCRIKREQIKRNTLTPDYIKHTIIYDLHLDKNSITPEQIELKKAQLTLYRQIKNQKS